MTITANIHIGLAAWSQNHAYSALGARISNGGNAYQVITTGTSQNTPGAGPTGTGSNITDGTVHWKYLSAIDFTSLQAWANSLPSTVTQNMVGQIWNDSVITTTAGTQILSLTGHDTTTNSTTITLTAAAGEGLRDATGALAFNTANGVAIQLPATGVGGINYLDIEDANVTFDSIQIQDPNSASNCTQVQCNQIGFTASNCIFDGFAQTGGASLLDLGLSCTVFNVHNSLFIDRRAGNSSDCVALTSDQNTSCAGAIVNCTFISTTPNLDSFAVLVHNTNTNGIAVKNCAFFGYSNPASNSSTSGAMTADHCVTDASAFPSNVTASANLFNKTAANQFVSATTDFRLNGSNTCDSVDAGTTDSTDIPSQDDIRRNARPRGNAWDIGAFEYGSTTSKALHVSAAQAPVANKAVMKPYPVASAEVVAAVATKAGLHGKAVAIAGTETVAITKVRGFSVAGASDAQSIAFATQFFRVCVVAARNLQSSLIKRFIGKHVSVTWAEAVIALKAVSKLPFNVSSGEAASTIKSPGKLALASGANVAFVRRQTAHLTPLPQGQAIQLLFLAARRLSAASGQAMAVARNSIISKNRIQSAQSPETAAAIAGRLFFRVLSGASSESAHSFQGRLKISILQVAQGFSASIQRAMVKFVPLTDGQAASVSRSTSRLFKAVDAEAASAAKSVGLNKSAVDGSAAAVIHTPGKVAPIISSERVGLTRAIFRSIPGATTTQTAAKAILRTLSKALAAGSGESASAGRGVTHAAQAASSGQQATARSIGKRLSVAAALKVAFGRALGAVRPSISATASPESTALARGIGRNFLSTDGQTVTTKANRGHIAFMAMAEGTRVSKVVHVFRVVVSPQVVAASKQQRRFPATTSPSSAFAIASRAKFLSVAQATVVRLVKWFHLFVPESLQQNRVLLPPAGGPAEPPTFSDMDPADQSIFLFDWSARAEPGDAIASASVVSLPTGLNFVGPLFTDNMVVEVTLGPYMPPELPMTYGLRCSVTFVSGERSSFTIPVRIRTL